MPRVVTLLVLVSVIFAFAAISSINSDLGSSAPSAVADLFSGFASDALACTGGCKGKP